VLRPPLQTFIDGALLAREKMLDGTQEGWREDRLR
jgi:hypothetical protein